MALLVRNVSPIPLPGRMKMSHMFVLMYGLKGGYENWLLGNQGAEMLMPLFLSTGTGDGGGIGR